MIAVVVIHYLLVKIVFPLNAFAPTEINEMLSIPIMQTARVLHFYSEELTEEEKKDIDGMWDYEKLSMNYEYDISDPSKSTYRRSASRADVIKYFETWAMMFFHYPGEYIQATINNYYNYFFPGSRQAEMISYNAGEEAMSRLNEAFSMLEMNNMNLHYPQRMMNIRSLYEGVRYRLFKMPFISLLVSVGFYTWILLISFTYCFLCRGFYATMCYIPLFLILLVCLAGPCNGEYLRYYYPIILCLPASISLSGMCEKKR